MPIRARPETRLDTPESSAHGLLAGSSAGPSSPAAATPAASRLQLLLAGFRRRLEEELAAWLAHRRTSGALVAGPAGDDLDTTLAELLLRGGKRLRPALVHFSHAACGGGEERRVLSLAMALELLHTYLLVHDDIMDRSATRRGRPTAHARYRDLHVARGWAGSAEHFGQSVGLLVGDLAYAYAVELAMAATPPGPTGDELRSAFGEMCREVIVGQYLEFTVPHREEATEEELLEILRLKSGAYSVERPVQLGAILAGAPAAMRQGLSRYGRCLGEAFQLQDDLLGTFGEPATTGKPVGSDLREGKRTLLVHHALQRADAADRARILGVLGDGGASEAAIGAARAALLRSGARAVVERLIEERLAAASRELAALELSAPGRDVLAGLVDWLRERDQ